ncbi:MAG: NAD(P)/FAD-dependent oxidoreductase [Candidatus Aenigmatarchaeota archaeon]
MIEKDVVIVGGGVAGLKLSGLLEKKNIDFMTLEQNGSIGKYGNRIVNTDVARKLNLRNDDILYEIKEMKFISPSGMMINKKSNDARGYVTNVRNIEKLIFESLEKKDNIRLDSHVKNIDFENNILIANGFVVKAKVIIIASGIIQNRFMGKLSITSPRIVFCYTNEIKGSDIITTVLDNNLAHGFYGWVMPLGEDIVEVGFGTDHIGEIKTFNLKNHLFSLTYLSKYRENEALREVGGFIPSSMSATKCGTNWIAIGDSAGGEPLMGGSIHKCLNEAEMAAATIERYFKGDISSLKGYDHLWKKNFGDEIEKQDAVRELIDNSANRELDEVFRRLDGKEIDGHGLINDIFRNIIMNLKDVKNS